MVDAVAYCAAPHVQTPSGADSCACAVAIANMATPGPSSRRCNKDGKPILSVTEIMDMLHVDDVDISDDDDADEDEDVVTTIIMDPPDELPEADTDEDSADSDDPDDPTGVHLPRKLLMAGGQRVRRAKRRPLFYGDQRRGVEGENKDEEDEEDGMDRGMNNNNDDVEENNNVDEENENEDEDEDYNNEDEDEDYQQDEGKKRKRGKGKKGQGKKSKGNKGKGKKDNKDEEKETWSETDSGKVGSNISEFTESPEPDLSHLKTAYDYYMEFQPREFKEEVLHQSKLYAAQKAKKREESRRGGGGGGLGRGRRRQREEEERELHALQAQEEAECEDPLQV